MKYKIAIDGACRRNGKPDCVSAGATFIQRFNDDGILESSYVDGSIERCSTNQRGELFALIKALSILVDTCKIEDTAIIVTDSEYIYNAMTKGWIASWEAKGYITAAGEDVKNADLWKFIGKLSNMIKCEISYYHIKGHVLQFGKVTAKKLLQSDCTGRAFCTEFDTFYDTKLNEKTEAIEKAKELFKNNHDFDITDELIKDFITINAVADTAATIFVEKADSDTQS